MIRLICMITLRYVQRVGTAQTAPPRPRLKAFLMIALDSLHSILFTFRFIYLLATFLLDTHDCLAFETPVTTLISGSIV
jgi:hypothetical protein